MAPEASTGEHERSFRPIWLEGRIPHKNGPTVHLRCPRITALRFLSSRARCLLEIYITVISQFHDRPKLEMTANPRQRPNYVTEALKVATELGTYILPSASCCVSSQYYQSQRRQANAASVL
jgi:hypothetical protein